MKKLSKLTMFFLAGVGIYFQQNKVVKKSTYEIKSNKIPASFDDFKIAQLSDIHCDKIGFSDLIFLKNLRDEKPDIIFITGDILDSYRNNSAVAHNILSQIADIAPCYFVSGNHELRLTEEYEKLKLVLKKLGITNLNNSNVELKRDNETIKISGIEDFNYFIYSDRTNYYANHKNMLVDLYDENIFTILLAHRPEKFDIYNEVGYDLIFSGHAHGGQWNVPFVGRIFSPSQGFFPTYTNGIYKNTNSTMIVSQGLGNSSFPTRINNRLELVIVKLKTGEV